MTHRSATLRSPGWYSALCVVVPLGVIALCIAALRLGYTRAENRTNYFYEIFDVGHPGIVNVVASMGLVSTAAIALVLAAAKSDVPYGVASALFTVVAGDNLLRLHNQIPAGDVLVRLAYWSVLAWLFVRLRLVLHGRRGTAMLFIGITTFVVSEMLDVVNGDPHSHLAVVEESLACLGAWCLAVAAIGFASDVLADHRPVSVPG